MAKAGKGLLEGTLQAGTSAVSDKLLDLVGLGGKSAADKGKDTRDYLAAAFPELNAWERAGADASSAGMVDAGFFFFQAEDGIRDYKVTGVQTCALPIYHTPEKRARPPRAHHADHARPPQAPHPRRGRRRGEPSGDAAVAGARGAREIGRASCRERV